MRRMKAIRYSQETGKLSLEPNWPLPKEKRAVFPLDACKDLVEGGPEYDGGNDGHDCHPGSAGQSGESCRVQYGFGNYSRICARI